MTYLAYEDTNKPFEVRELRRRVRALEAIVASFIAEYGPVARCMDCGRLFSSSDTAIVAHFPCSTRSAVAVSRSSTPTRRLVGVPAPEGRETGPAGSRPTAVEHSPPAGPPSTHLTDDVNTHTKARPE